MFLCRAVFSVSHGGKADIVDHVNTKRHKAALFAKSSSQSLTSFLDKKNLGDQEREPAAQEVMFVYHTVKHNHGFQSMDCTLSISKKFLNKKFTCAQTKCKAVVADVLSPYTKSQILEDLKNIKYCCFAIDASNHIDLRSVSIIVRYFIPDKGIATEILEFSSLPLETSDLVDYILEAAQKHDIADKIIDISADNTNTNFGGLKRKGKNNVFTKLQEKLNTKIIGVGCAAHIIHNGVQTVVDVLPTDIQAILGKVFQYFHQFTVRVESLKYFCDFVEI
jgi:hypothetical protein